MRKLLLSAYPMQLVMTNTYCTCVGHLGLCRLCKSHGTSACLAQPERKFSDFAGLLSHSHTFTSSNDTNSIVEILKQCIEVMIGGNIDILVSCVSNFLHVYF